MFKQFYTTQMSAKGRALQTRFMKIRSGSGRTARIMGAAAALALTAGFVCATVVMAVISSDAGASSYNVAVYSAGAELELKSKPFVQGDEVYFPLREMLVQLKVTDDKDNYLLWENGKAALHLADENREITYIIEPGVRGYMYETAYDHSSQIICRSAPLFKDGVTYVTFEYLSVMSPLYEKSFGYRVYSGEKEVSRFDYDEYSSRQGQAYELTRQFFDEYISSGRLDDARNMCTESFSKKYLAGDTFFGMPRASLATVYSINCGNTIYDNMNVYVECMLYSENREREMDARIKYTAQQDGSLLIDDIAEISTESYVFFSAARNDAYALCSAWTQPDFNRMKEYCTEKFIKDYFRFTDDDGKSVMANVYDIQKLKDYDIDFTDTYSDSSVTLRVAADTVLPAHSSMLGGEREFYLVMQRQPDGSWKADDIAGVWESDMFRTVYDYLTSEFMRVYSPHYEILNLHISDWHENGNEAELLYTMTYNYFYKDPDTVDYIIDAKKRGDKNYETYKKEYLEPKQVSYRFKAVLEDGEIKLYEDVAPKGREWVPVKVDDFID